MTGCPVGQGVSGLYYEYQKNSLSYDDVVPAGEEVNAMDFVNWSGRLSHFFTKRAGRFNRCLAYMPAILITIVTVCFFYQQRL